MKTLSETRRSILRKVSFLAPAIVSFKLAELKAHASGINVSGSELGVNEKDKNNVSQGNHYGNDKPDMNPNDKNNKHNGSNNIH